MSKKRFGRLVVLAEDGARWTVRCDCGTTNKVVRKKELLRRDGRAQLSCGCLQREAVAKMGRERNRTHGMKGTPTWRTWSGMKNRCLNPNNAAYAKYGGRGITVCERWQSFENFFADMGERPDGLTLDRIDNEAGYSPENCRWASKKTQARNTRANRLINGQPMVQAAEATDIPYRVVRSRIWHGWTSERALSEPVDITRRSHSFKPR